MTTLVDSDHDRTVARRIERLYELPPMPELGQRILALQSNPKASALELAEIIQLDPSLAAQVIRYANSPYYGYNGQITTIQDAIARVLGFDMVMNLALGLSAGRSFRIPDQGPLGLTRFWQNAVCSAILVQNLGAALPKGRQPNTGVCYLAGLLHDFGLLLLAHLFPPEFQLLNKFAQAHPGSTVAELEKCLIGMGQARDLLAMGHARIGAWLMEAWRMPQVLQVTLLEHHNPDYSGEYEQLVHLVQLSDFLLLHEHELPEPGKFPAATRLVLQLLPEQALEIFDQTMIMREQLTALSRQLAAAS